MHITAGSRPALSCYYLSFLGILAAFDSSDVEILAASQGSPSSWDDTQKASSAIDMGLDHILNCG